MTFMKEGHKFETVSTQSGEVRLYYYGKENDFAQFITWLCDDEAEALDMVEAVIDPARFADDEYHARHMSEILSNCKW